MQGTRKELLARAAFPFQQDRRIRSGRALQGGQHLRQLGILPDDLGSPAASAEFLFQQDVLGDHSSPIDGSIHEQHQMHRVDRLREEIECPLFHGRDGVFNTPVGGHDDHRDVWIKLFDGAEDTEPITVGQPQVREHDRLTRPLKETRGLRFVACLDRRVPVAF